MTAPRHAIITGGSSGIGKETARLLVARGADITLIARTRATLAVVADELMSGRVRDDQRVRTIPADVADRDQAEHAVADAIAELGPPEYLVTSAGIARPGYCQEVPIEVFERTMAVNYFGTLYTIMAALPAMRARGRGAIVLLSSGAGLIGLFGYTPYCPTKFAVRGLAESLRAELRPWGVHVAVVYAPDTDTPMLAEENLTKPAETKRITGTARTWSPEGVATAIVRGVERRQFVIAPGLGMRMLARHHSLARPVLDWYFDRIVARTRTAQDEVTAGRSSQP